MTTDHGAIYEVRNYVAGGRLAADAASTATTLQLDDASDFSETGGTLTVTSFDGTNYITTPYTYLSADLTTDQVTLDGSGGGLAANAVEGDRVDVSPRQVEKHARVVLNGTEEAITAKIPHSLKDLLSEGIRTDGARETVNLTLIHHDWWITDMPTVASTLRSSDYTAGGAGWSLADGSVQMTDASMLGTTGADDFTANTIALAGQDMGTEVLPGMSNGREYYGRADGTTAAISTSGTTETVLFTINAGTFRDTVAYWFMAKFHATGTVAGDLIDFRIRYTTTTDGSTPSDPTSASSELIPAVTRFVVPNVTGNGGDVVMMAQFWLSLGSDYNLKMALTGTRNAGTGTAKVYQSATDRVAQFLMLDMGVRSNGLDGGVLTGSTSGTITYTKTYWATDGMSYYGGPNYNHDPETPQTLWAGNYVYVGNMKSLSAFNYTQIQSDLTGATVTSCKLTFRVKNTVPSNGAFIVIKEHNFTSFGSTYSGTPTTLLTTSSRHTAGQTVTVELGTTFGSALKAGTQKGTGFGPALDSSYNYSASMYGHDEGSSAPHLTITYTK